MTKADTIAEWAESIALDDSHGYSQINRWGSPDYDCSSLCIMAAEAAGISVRSYGATYTGNMVSAFQKAGFHILTYTPDMALVRGDILLNVQHHASVYIGGNKLVEAAIDENGGIQGSSPGDQTGHEIHVRILYNFPWDYVLRYEESETPAVTDPDCSYTKNNVCTIYGPQIKYRDYGPAVAAAQGALNYHGFGKLELTGFFDATTLAAVNRFQSVHKLTIDGIVGPETWKKLLYWR